MKCDEREIPDSLSDPKPELWFTAHTSYFGRATPTDEAVGGDAPPLIQFASLAALALCADRLIGIISPGIDPSASDSAALWWSWPRPSFSAEAFGSQGLFKKRPSGVKLDRNGGIDNEDGGEALVLKVVSRLYRNSLKSQTGQEVALLEALQPISG